MKFLLGLLFIAAAFSCRLSYGAGLTLLCQLTRSIGRSEAKLDARFELFLDSHQFVLYEDLGEGMHEEASADFSVDNDRYFFSQHSKILHSSVSGGIGGLLKTSRRDKVLEITSANIDRRSGFYYAKRQLVERYWENTNLPVTSTVILSEGADRGHCDNASAIPQSTPAPGLLPPSSDIVHL